MDEEEVGYHKDEEVVDKRVEEEQCRKSSWEEWTKKVEGFGYSSFALKNQPTFNKSVSGPARKHKELE
jgi:hypothetical protein